jgi:hypothetical protein
MSESKKINLTVVVTGKPVEIEIAIDNPLGTVVTEALEQSHSTGRPATDWELKDRSNNPFSDLNKTVEEYGIQDKAVLYLDLRAGGGGCV